MVELDKLTLEDLFRWYTLNQKLKEDKAAESLLRKRIFNFWFSNPVEGSGNKSPLNDGYTLKANYVVNRAVDEAALDATRDQLEGLGVTLDDVIKWKPELKKAGYNKLTDEQRAVFDSVLKVSDGSPQLEIVNPKK